MHYRIFALVLALVLMVSFAGCTFNKIDSPDTTASSAISVNIPSEFGDDLTCGICPMPKSEEELRTLAEGTKNYGESYLSNRSVSEVACYVSQDCAILIRRITFGALLSKITAYVADIYIDNVSQLAGCVLTDENGSIVKGTPEDVIAATDALFVINSDFMRSRSWGLYVRQGKVWRSKPTSGVDLCIIGKDGKMKICNGDSFDSEACLKDNNLFHVFTFGPSLLNEDGSARNEDAQFHITDRYSRYNDYESSVGFPVANPRTAIGQAEDGHFLLVAVDGRSKGYSKGMTFPELSHLMYEEGAVVAYNLDGGGSVFMYYEGEPVNRNSGGRSPSDYICVLKKKQ